MSARPCTRYAVRIRFADEDVPRWLFCTSNHVVTVHSVEPPLHMCTGDQRSAELLLRHAGSPWSLPLAEEPHVVEVDVTLQLERKHRELLDDAESIRAELAAACTYPTKEANDAKL